MPASPACIQGIPKLPICCGPVPERAISPALLRLIATHTKYRLSSVAGAFSYGYTKATMKPGMPIRRARRTRISHTCVLVCYCSSTSSAMAVRGMERHGLANRSQPPSGLGSLQWRGCSWLDFPSRAVRIYRYRDTGHRRSITVNNYQHQKIRKLISLGRIDDHSSHAKLEVYHD
jgi:hypothetical protein